MDTSAEWAGTFHCPQCGYDLRGQTVERCPECGFHYDIPALAALNAQMLDHCLVPYLDAQPFLLVPLAVFAGNLAAWALLRAAEGGGGIPLDLLCLVFPAFAMYLLLAMRGGTLHLRAWILDESPESRLWPGSLARLALIPLWRMAPWSAIAMVVLLVPAMVFVALFSLAIAVAATAIAAGWTLLAEGRRWDIGHHQDVRFLAGIRRTDRARRLTWVLVLADVGSCVVLAAMGG